MTLWKIRKNYKGVILGIGVAFMCELIILITENP